MTAIDFSQILVITSPIWMDLLVKAIYRDQINRNRSFLR